MHAARGVLTVRGGMTSHAAVIARGIGLPCVVGAADLRLDPAAQTLTSRDGRLFREGALITLDGTSGQVSVGASATIPPELGGAFSDLLEWADAARDLGVRANADTAAEVRAALEFRADGVGLCRTEHMFFAPERLMVMREMILADTDAERQAALDQLLPMQRADFIEIFEIMRGLPVTIRLLDPPLHEFLPTEAADIAALAEAMGVPAAAVTARARDLAEVNPMLGMRGVRLGVVMPAIYEMQAQAIFEAAIAVNRDSGAPVVPEVMIPLVSANREVELVKARIDAVAAAVRARPGRRLHLSPRGDGRDPARGASRRGSRGLRGLPLLRDQRPDADDLRPQPRRRRAVHARLCQCRGLSRGPLPLARPRGRGRADADRRQARGGRATPISSSASAASMVAIPRRCASARSRASTTSPARPSACRSRAWRRRRRRCSPAAPEATVRHEAPARRSCRARRRREGSAGARALGARDRARRSEPRGTPRRRLDGSARAGPRADRPARGRQVDADQCPDRAASRARRHGLRSSPSIPRRGARAARSSGTAPGSRRTPGTPAPSCARWRRGAGSAALPT